MILGDRRQCRGCSALDNVSNEGISTEKSDNVLQRTLSNQVLDIGPLQKVGGARLESDRARIGENVSTILKHPNLDIQILRWGIIGSEIEIDSITIRAKQGVIPREESSLRT